MKLIAELRRDLKLLTKRGVLGLLLTITERLLLNSGNGLGLILLSHSVTERVYPSCEGLAVLKPASRVGSNILFLISPLCKIQSSGQVL